MRAVAFLLLSLPLLAADRWTEIKLWPGGAPGSEGITAEEVSTPAKDPKYAGLAANYTVTHYPATYAFLPPKGKATGAAMIVAPGGGHRQLVTEKEGWEVADWLNDHGIAAFVLKYRLARVQGSKYTLPEHVYADAARSMRIVRSRAAEWGVDPARIGFIGFSAGGEVGGMIGTKFDAGDPNAADPIERASSRPDFNILIYPWYRPGAFPRSPQQDLFPVPDNAPPTFMVCTDEDRSHVEPTVKFYLELLAKKIPTEMHIYQAGPHGFGLRPTAKPLPVNRWPVQTMEWLVDRGIVPASTTAQNAPLESTFWRLVELNGKPVESRPGTRQVSLTLASKEKGQANGFAGCNGFFGQYALNGASIKFDKLGSTMMACPEPNPEREYLQTLGKVTGYRIAGNTLELTDGTTVVARFAGTPVTKSN